jgi:hypothetical protein
MVMSEQGWKLYKAKVEIEVPVLMKADSEEIEHVAREALEYELMTALHDGIEVKEMSLPVLLDGWDGDEFVYGEHDGDVSLIQAFGLAGLEHPCKTRCRRVGVSTTCEGGLCEECGRKCP